MQNYFVALLVFITACSAETDLKQHASEFHFRYAAITGQGSIRVHLFDHAREGDTATELCIHSPFLYFRSGRMIWPDVTTAVVATEQTDSTIRIELLTLHQGIWTQQSEIEVSGPGAAFSMEFADYNFDERTDIYQNVSCSNGYALRRGNLLIVDASTMQMQHHPEAAELANMRTDKQSSTVRSAIWVECKNTMMDTCELTSTWINGLLVTTDTVCPCALLQ